MVKARSVTLCVDKTVRECVQWFNIPGFVPKLTLSVVVFWMVFSGACVTRCTDFTRSFCMSCARTISASSVSRGDGDPRCKRHCVDIVYKCMCHVRHTWVCLTWQRTCAHHHPRSACTGTRTRAATHQPRVTAVSRHLPAGDLGGVNTSQPLHRRLSHNQAQQARRAHKGVSQPA